MRLIAIALCLALLLSVPVHAAEDPKENGVVTVAAIARPSVVGVLTTFRSESGPSRPRGAGTGFVYKNGWIMTNAHVVEGGIEVKVLMPDKRVVDVDPEKDVFYDATSDIAVIRVNTSGLSPLPFARSSELQVGQQVIAVGNPLGFRLGNSVTMGILSGMGRTLGSGYPFLQTDAPINPGNSGGPLLNMSAQVIGVNSAKMAGIGMEGLGFAIPSDTAREIAETLIATGRVERVALGLLLEEGWEAVYGIPSEEGLQITGVVPDGPAGMSGLMPGDMLMKIDDQKAETSDDLTSYLSGKKPGDVVILTVQRQGLMLTTPIRLVSREAVRVEAEEIVVERGGILRNLTTAQLQEAAQFGQRLAEGWAGIPAGYFARSGSNNWATLYTEYMYVARRVQSVTMFGYSPSPDFVQLAAQNIRGQLEFSVEINGDKPEFLKGAAAVLKQSGKERSGTVQAAMGYSQAADGSVVIGSLKARFPTDWLDPAGELELVVQLPDGKSHTFTFKLRDLR